MLMGTNNALSRNKKDKTMNPPAIARRIRVPSIALLYTRIGGLSENLQKLFRTHNILAYEMLWSNPRTTSQKIKNVT